MCVKACVHVEADHQGLACLRLEVYLPSLAAANQLARMQCSLVLELALGEC
jgi:hypothetical protein